MKSKKVIISGGGTGGHIFPAIAIANALKKFDENMDILFVGAKDRMEMQKVPEAGYPIRGLWISGIKRKLSLTNLFLPLKVIVSIIHVLLILLRFKPNAVVGVGGYSSWPVVFTAAFFGIPCLIQEQNSYAGVANKYVAGKVKKICVAYDQMEKYFPAEKIVLTGNPIRRAVFDKKFDLDAGKERYKLDKQKLTILAVGGSLGSGILNEAVVNGIDQFKSENIQLILQTGSRFYQSVKSKVNEDWMKVVEFIDDIGEAYAIADVIVSRAGAIAISELCLVGKPVILIPWSGAVEQHQEKNAMSLAEKDAAIVIKDVEANKKLAPAIMELIGDQKGMKRLAENIKKLARPHATEDIAKELINLI